MLSCLCISSCLFLVFIFTLQDLTRANSVSSSLHSQAMAYARLAEAPNIKLSSSETHEDVLKLNGEGDLLTVLPVSAESAGLLPKRHGKSLVTSAADRIPCFYLG